MATNPVISALVATIPDEEGASFVAQVGEPGRIASHAGSVEVGSTVLTVAEIDALNASIFPRDQLRTLQQTGGATFYFSLPGVDSWFTALAGMYGDDRWLEVRRRKTATPQGLRPAAEAAAVPQEAPAAPATPTTDEFDDLADLASLEFPSKHVEGDADALSLSQELYEELGGHGRVEPKHRRSWATDSWNATALDSRRARAILCPPTRTRKWVQVGILVVACLAVALLGIRYVGASEPSPSALRTAPSHSSLPAPKSPPPRASVTPVAQAAPPSTGATASPPAAPAPTPTTSPVRTTGSNTPAEAGRTAEQPRSGFSVQIAAVETREEADRLVTRFVTRGYSAYFTRGEGAAANYYRVRIGAFADRQTAENVARQLADTDGIKPWIAKEEGSSPR